MEITNQRVSDTPDLKIEWVPDRMVSFERRPHKGMRYDTLGDWFYDDNGLLRVIVATDDGIAPISTKEQKLILLHELIEVWLCEEEGITQKMVDDFDFAWDHRGDPEVHAIDDEPGDDPRAPYRIQHRRAMIMEHLFANFLGMDDYGVIR